MVHLLLLRITQRCVVLVIFILSLVVFFFFLFLVIIIVIVVPIVIVIIQKKLLSFCHCFLSVFSRRYPNYDLEGLLLLRNVLRRVVSWLLLRQHISWRHLIDGQTSNALVGCVARTNHLKFRNRRE
jgi:hypothetical protein